MIVYFSHYHMQLAGYDVFFFRDKGLILRGVQVIDTLKKWQVWFWDEKLHFVGDVSRNLYASRHRLLGHRLQYLDGIRVLRSTFVKARVDEKDRDSEGAPVMTNGTNHEPIY